MKSPDRRIKKSTILPEETVVFFPTFAHFDEASQTWRILIHGWIFDQRVQGRLKAMTMRLFCRWLGIDQMQAQAPLFQERSRAFLVSGGRGKRLSIRVGSHIFTLQKASGAGHFRGVIKLTPEEVEELLPPGTQMGGPLTFQAVTMEDDRRIFHGEVQLIANSGLSVISDIDDTIKHSVVANRRTLLTKTFLQEFEAVPGMAELYSRWNDQGASFHYVSASPWQLYEPLVAFLRDEGFPSGTFHLKSFRWKHTGVFKLFASPKFVKRRAIQTILRSFPQRRFLFVGDSGQVDPEIYGSIIRRNPHQLGAIFIRNINGESPSSPRMQKAFRGIPPECWRLFRDPTELADYPLPLTQMPAELS